MKIKYLLASIVIALATTTVSKASTNDSNQTFHCQTDGETITTVAKKADGEDLTIFNWRREVFPEDLNIQNLCESVSQKLESYATEGNQLSSFRTYNFNGIPLVCGEEDGSNCSLVLFSLNSNDDQRESNLILQQILDDGLKVEDIKHVERGIQFYGYKVDFWSLLGF
ncbi:MAG: COP23 domain-containing protein [Xenococcus sp. (in: cyanobacteria)]